MDWSRLCLDASRRLTGREEEAVESGDIFMRSADLLLSEGKD